MDINSIRLKLKEFEYSFAERHSRKPDRHDIKANPEISSLYKTYEKLRKSKSRPSTSSESPRTPSRKKSLTNPFVVEKSPTRTPTLHSQKLKQDLQTVTPKRSPFLETTPLINSVGPTPQTEGRVLGLFDALSPLKRRNLFDGPDTPSKVTKMTPTLSPIPSSPAIFRVSQSSESPLKLFRRPRGKCLSTLIAEIREFEDEVQDEGEEVLRELEEGRSGDTVDAQVTLNQTTGPLWRKKATQKIKRRVKLRPVRTVSVQENMDFEQLRAQEMPLHSEERETKNIPVPKRSAKVSRGSHNVSKNFRSLKLRNRGAKGGRFGRRR